MASAPSVALFERGRDECIELGMTARSHLGAGAAPVVEAGTADSQQMAHRLVRLLHVDESVACRYRDSFAKKAVAFFRISRSSLRRRTSRRRRAQVGPFIRGEAAGIALALGLEPASQHLVAEAKVACGLSDFCAWLGGHSHGIGLELSAKLPPRGAGPLLRTCVRLRGWLRLPFSELSEISIHVRSSSALPRGSPLSHTQMVSGQWPTARFSRKFGPEIEGERSQHSLLRGHGDPGALDDQVFAGPQFIAAPRDRCERSLKAMSRLDGSHQRESSCQIPAGATVSDG